MLTERLAREVHGQAQYVPAAEAAQATGSDDEEKPERAHAPEEIRVGALADRGFGSATVSSWKLRIRLWATPAPPGPASPLTLACIRSC